MDMYNPLANLRHYDMRLSCARSNSEAFLAHLQQGHFVRLSLRAPPGRGGACATAGHLQEPHFAFDPDVATLFLSGIPPDVSVWQLLDFFQELPGFAAAAMSRPPTRGVPTRTLKVRFASTSEAKSALAAWPEAELANQGCGMSLAELPPHPQVEALVVPPEMSHPEQIQRDLALSARVVRQLDALLGVPSKTTELLLGHAGSHEAKLDLQLLYLRRVHHFCFYGATWAENEWDLLQSSGPAVLRAPLMHDPAPGIGIWAESHMRRLERFLATVRLDRPMVPGIDDEPLREQCAKLCEESAQPIAECKFKCTHCGKRFKGSAFVAKHARKMHAEIFERLRQEVLMETARMAFLEDPVSPDPSGLPTVPQQAAPAAVQ